MTLNTHDQGAQPADAPNAQPDATPIPEDQVTPDAVDDHDDDPRAAIYAEYDRHRRGEVEGEGDDGQGDDGDAGDGDDGQNAPDATPEGEGEGDEPPADGQDGQDQPKDDKAADQPPAGGETYTITVDGKQLSLTRDELIARAQMAEASRARLDQAAEERRRAKAEVEQAKAEAERIIAEARAKAEGGQQQDQGRPAPQQQAEDQQAKIKRIAETLINGDEDAVQAALAEVLSNQQQPATPEAPEVLDFRQAVQEELNHQREVEAYQKFLSETPEMDSMSKTYDDDFTALVNSRMTAKMTEDLELRGGIDRADLAHLSPAEIGQAHAALRRQGLADSIDALMIPIVSGVRARFQSQQQTPAGPAPKTTADQRRDAKRGLAKTAAPTGAGRAAPPPPPAKLPSPDEYVEQLKRERFG